MANAHMTSTTDLPAPINFFFFDTFLRRANQQLVYFALTHPGRLSRHGGSLSVKWRRYEQATPTTSALAEPTGNVAFPLRAAITPSRTDVTAAVAKYGQYYLLNEEADFVNPTGYTDELMAILGQVAGRSLNRLARDEAEGNSTQIRVGGAAADNAITQPMTKAVANRVVRVLKGNSALKFFTPVGASTKYNTTPINDAFLAITHTDASPDWEAMQGFKSVEQYMDAADKMPGEIGYVGRIRVLETEEASSSANGGGAAANNNLISTGGTSADLYNSIVAGMYYMGAVGVEGNHPDSPKYADDKIATVELITHERGDAGVYDALNELASMGWKAWAKFKITNTGWGRRVTHGATNYQ